MALNKDLLEMLDGTQTFLSKLVLEMVEMVLTAAVYDLSGKPLEGKVKEINYGTSKKTGNHVLDAAFDEGGCVVEFNEDKTEAWVAQLSNVKVPLTGTTREVALKVFSKVEASYGSIMEEMNKLSAAAIARKEFVSELRYGTQQQLIDEFYSIFDETKARILERFNEDQIFLEKAGMINRPEITDILQYLKDNKEDVFNVKVINDNYKLD